MNCYKRDRKRVDSALRKSGIVVVMSQGHIKNPEHMVTTMQAVYDHGLVAEVTFRIEEGILREAMQELVKRREKSPADNPFLLGIGSVINPKELDAAIEMGFDMVVAPANVTGGHGDCAGFLQKCRQNNVFCTPAIFTPTELNCFLERPDGLEPDAIKIFPAGVYGPKGFADLLAPFERPRHKGRIIMTTGSVNYETGPEYIKAISSRGFTPVLGMSAPLQLVLDRKAPGNIDVINESLRNFKARFFSVPRKS